MEELETDSVPMTRSGSYGLLPPEMSEPGFPHEEVLSGHDRTPGTLRVALVGKTGCGKSSCGNTILGRKAFKAKTSSKSVTQGCQKEESCVDGRRVAIVDTPGLFDTTQSNDKILMETAKTISFLAPGPHAFLLVLKIGRFTKEEMNTVEYIKRAFGESSRKYIMILFTHGDTLEEDETQIEEYLEDGDEDLKRFITEHENRFHVFNNREKDRTQVKELLQKIDDMVMRNGGSFYTNRMLQEAEAAIEKEKGRILKEREEEIRRNEEEIRRKYIQEMEKQKREQNLRERKNQDGYLTGEIERMKRAFQFQARREAENQNPFLVNFLRIITCGIL